MFKISGWLLIRCLLAALGYRNNVMLKIETGYRFMSLNFVLK